MELRLRLLRLLQILARIGGLDGTWMIPRCGEHLEGFGSWMVKMGKELLQRLGRGQEGRSD